MSHSMAGDPGRGRDWDVPDAPRTRGTTSVAQLGNTNWQSVRCTSLDGASELDSRTRWRHWGGPGRQTDGTDRLVLRSSGGPGAPVASLTVIEPMG